MNRCRATLHGTLHRGILQKLTNQELQKQADRTNILQLALIHPELYLRTASEAIELKQEIAEILELKDPRISLKKMLFSLPTLTKERLSRKMKQL